MGDGDPCVICGDPNDMGEICAKCAKENRDVTVAGFMESDKQSPYNEYGFDHPWEDDDE